MRRILANQSELSVASAIFYFSGGLIALLAITLFRREDNPLNLANLITSCIAFFISGLFFFAGRRVGRPAALLLLCGTATVILSLSFVSMSALRAANSGLFFYTFLIYLVWFGPMRLARIFGYTWLAIYCVVAGTRFGPEMYPLLVTLAITSVMLGELVGAFRRRLEATSLTDPLCRVWNKRGLEVLLKRTIQIMQRNGSSLSMLFLDLDDFKRINDTEGHSAGDRVLRAFSSQIEAATRPQDTLARVGGDEFVLLLPGATAEKAQETAQRLRQVVDAAAWSFGVAEMRAGETAEEFIERADRVLLEEKRRRKTAAEG